MYQGLVFMMYSAKSDYVNYNYVSHTAWKWEKLPWSYGEGSFFYDVIRFRE
ncbi:hypothetical protein PMEGAPR236_12650 [Priestia megaterium]